MGALLVLLRMLLVLQEPCGQCTGACRPGGIAIAIQPFSQPQLLARSSIQKSSDSSLSEQCILFWGTLTTEGNFCFFTRRKLGRRAIYKERMCSYSERCLKVPGTPGTKTLWKQVSLCQSKWSLGMISASSSPFPSPRFPSQEKGAMTPHKRQT